MCIGKLNIVKMTVLTKEMDRFSVIVTKIPTAFICRNGQTDPKPHMDLQGIPNRQNSLEKE